MASPYLHTALLDQLTNQCYGGKDAWFIREAHTDMTVTGTAETPMSITPKLCSQPASQQGQEQVAGDVFPGSNITAYSPRG